MNARLLLVCLMPLLMAASCTPRPTQPLDAHCDSLCETPCSALTGWDGDRDADRLGALMDAHDVQHAECDQHRAACVACLDTARKAGAIK